MLQDVMEFILNAHHKKSLRKLKKQTILKNNSFTNNPYNLQQLKRNIKIREHWNNKRYFEKRCKAFTDECGHMNQC